MIYSAQGTLKFKSEVLTGTSARGQWAKQDFVLEINENNFLHAIKFSSFRVDVLKTLETAQIGDPLKVDFYIECNESKKEPGRFFNEISAHAVQNQINRTVSTAPFPTTATAAPKQAPKPQPQQPEAPAEDMPF